MQHIDKKRRYIKAMQDIDTIAIKNGISPDSLALKIVKENRPEIERYVKMHGGNPDPNPAVLAAQACIIHENKIAHMQASGVPDYEMAENRVLSEDQTREDLGKSDSFAPALLGTLFKAGKKAITNINNKRIANGKKPILSGQKFQNLVKKVGQHVNIQTNENGLNIGVTGLNTAPPKPLNQQSDLSIIAGSVMDQMETDKKNDYIKKNLPLIALAIVALILIIKQSK